METPFLLLVIVLGLILGSFFNVLIVRLPRNEFWKNTRSVCPACSAPIRSYDNIPLLSFALLRGRCRDCRQPISWRYPLVEAATALLAALLFYSQPWPLDNPKAVLSLAGNSFILLFLVPASFIDIEHRILPDSITLGGLGLVLLLSLIPGGITPLNAALGVLCGGGVLYTVGFVGTLVMKKEAMGGGDIKLMAMAGALLGPERVLLALFLGSFIGALVGIIFLAKKKQSEFPFGPSLAAGILLSYCWGGAVVRWYLSFLS